MISQVMQDPKAAEYYTAIAGQYSQLVLADKYILAKLAGNKSECTALECHVRENAQLNFQDDNVREGLRRLENYKSLRKPGTGGSADLKQIARQIEVDYSTGEYTVLPDGRAEFHVNHGTKIRCINMPGAVALVVAKYRKGWRKARLTA